MRKGLKELRPLLSETLITPHMSPEEKFQNAVLRPILKWQHPLIWAVFQAYCKRRKYTFFQLTKLKQAQYIKQALERDLPFRQQLFGIVIALFTLPEYEEYLSMEKDLRKRMAKLLIQRLQSVE